MPSSFNAKSEKSKAICMGKPCDLCGDGGFSDLAAICSLCDTHRHVYCMVKVPLEVPNIWLCEVCQPINIVASPKNREFDPLGIENVTRKIDPKRQKFVKTGKVKLIPTEEAIMLSSGQRSCMPQTITHLPKRTPTCPRTASIKQLSAKLESVPTLKSPPPSRTLTSSKLSSESQSAKEIKVVEDEISVACVEKCLSREHGNKALKVATKGSHSDTEAKKLKDQSSIAPLLSIEELPSNKSSGKSVIEGKTMLNDRQIVPNYIPNIPGTEATWKGSFEIITVSTPGKLYNGFVAHPALRVHQKAYNFSKQMPPVLVFKLLPRHNICSDIFNGEYPGINDIALYFTPGDSERSLENYVCLVEAMESHDSVICCYVGGGVEFLIFTSKLLDKDFQKSCSKNFLWGLFRRIKATANEEKTIETAPLLTQDPHYEENYEVDMEIDMIAGMDIGPGSHVVSSSQYVVL